MSEIALLVDCVYRNGSGSTYLYNLPYLPLVSNSRRCYCLRGPAEEHEHQSHPPGWILTFLKTKYLLGILYKASSWVYLPVGRWTHVLADERIFSHSRSQPRASYVPTLENGNLTCLLVCHLVLSTLGVGGPSGRRAVSEGT